MNSDKTGFRCSMKAMNVESARQIDDGWSVVCAEVTLPRMYPLKRICNRSKLNTRNPIGDESSKTKLKPTCSHWALGAG